MQDFRLSLEKTKKPATISAYLAAVEDFLKRTHSSEIIKKENIDSYLSYLNSNGLAYNSKLLKLAALKKYFQFKAMPELKKYIDDCLEDGMIKKIENQSKFKLDKEKIKTLRKKLKCESTRDRLIVDLLIDAGVRVSELLSISRSNLDFENKTISIYQQKQGTWRKVEITKALEVSLKAHLEHYKVEDKLFNLTRQAVDVILKRILKKASLPKQSAHMFRHYCLTSWAKQMPIQYVQVLSGHKHLSSLMRYAHLNFEDVIKYRKQHIII